MAICLSCSKHFSYEDYLEHPCPKTGYCPADFEHQVVLTNGRYIKISEKAIERGSE